MALPEYSGFSLQNDSYITTEIEYRTWPSRSVTTKKIARKPGSKFVAEEFGEKRIDIRGYIKGTSIADLKSKIDDLYTVLQKTSQLLQIESGRYYTASVASMAVGDPHYSQDFVPFELQFVCADPFAYGDPVSATATVTSGTVIQTFSTTISGSYFAEPSIIYTAPSGSGDTTTSGIRILHKQSGEWADWKGAGTEDIYLDYGDSITFDYKNYKVLQGTTQRNYTGTFSRWEPGTNEFEVTFGGNTVGGTIEITYTPRYL
ncbi:MAG: distal tail protein Dit [Candidatus Heimdallarchaeota archaeon]